MRLSQRLVCVGCGLTADSLFKRIGAGAFDYDFGALDDSDNPLTKSYSDIMYNHLSLLSVVKGFRCANQLSRFPVLHPSGTPRLFILFASTARWFPGLLTWIHDNSSHPGMQNLRHNKDEAHKVAWGLLDLKRQELGDGVTKRDVMSLLGLSPSFCCFYLRGS